MENGGIADGVDPNVLMRTLKTSARTYWSVCVSVLSPHLLLDASLHLSVYVGASGVSSHTVNAGIF